MGNVLDRVTDQLTEVKIFRQIGFKAMLAWHYLIMFSPIFVGTVEAGFTSLFFDRQFTLYTSVAVTFAILFLFTEIRKKKSSASSPYFIAFSGLMATAASVVPIFFLGNYLIPITVLLGISKATLMYLWIRYYQIVVSHNLIRNLAIDMIGGSLIAFLICILQPPFAGIAVVFLPVAATVSLIICRKTVKGVTFEHVPEDVAEKASTSKWRRVGRFLTMLLPTTVFAFVFAFLQGGYASTETILIMATEPGILLAISTCGLILLAMPKDVGANLGVDTIHRMSVLFFVFGILGLPLLDDGIVIFAEMSVLVGFNLFDFGAMIIGISIVQRLGVEKSFSAVSGRMFAYFSLACGLLVGYMVMTHVDDRMLFGYILSGVAVLLLVVTVVFPLRRVMIEAPAPPLPVIAPVSAPAVELRENAGLRSEGDTVKASVKLQVKDGGVDKHAPWKHLCTDVARFYGLSPRETEIFLLIAKGRNAEYVQKVLVVSIHTAKTHISNIYQKLGVHSSQELLNLIEEFREEAKVTKE